jgi:hypothetical protein
MSPQDSPKGELAPKRVARRDTSMSPQGSPKGELAPKREGPAHEPHLGAAQ